jgi:signal peptidase I
MSEKKKQKQSTARSALEWLKSIAIALAVWFVLQAMLVKAFHIPSGSMERTILVGDFLFVNKALYGSQVPLTNVRLPAIREPRRDDIVVFESVEDEGLDVVKRVVGSPGDTLEMRRDSLFRNGRLLDEPYVQHLNPLAQMDDVQQRMSRRWQGAYLVGRDTAQYMPNLRTWGPIAVPQDSYFVMGDNRDESYDSRYWGFLPRENIKGSPMFIYYSFDRSSWRPLPYVTAIRWDRLLRRPH